MSLSSESEKLRDQFLAVLLAAALPLQAGPDPEVALEALIGAAGLLRDRLRQDAAELRQEQAD